MSKVLTFKMARVKISGKRRIQRRILTPEILGQVVEKGIQDYCHKKVKVVVSQKPGLSVAAWGGSTNAGGAHVRFSLEDIWGTGRVWGQFAGLRIERDGSVVMLGDFWSIGGIGPLDTLLGVDRLSVGSDAWKLQQAIQRRMLESEVASLLKVSLEEAERLIKASGLSYEQGFTESQVMQIQAANELMAEFEGVDFPKAMAIATKLKITDAQGVKALKASLETSECLLPDVLAEDLDKYAPMFGFEVQPKGELLLVPAIVSEIPKAKIAGERVLVHKATGSRFILVPRTVEYKHPKTRRTETAKAWKIVGKKADVKLADGDLTTVQKFAAALATTRKVVPKIFPGEKVLVSMRNDPLKGKFVMAVVGKLGESLGAMPAAQYDFKPSGVSTVKDALQFVVGGE